MPPTNSQLAPDVDEDLDDKPITIIEPRAPGARARVRDLWTHRALLPYFARTALERRYRRTVLGPLWLVLRPAAQVLPGALIFGSVLGAPSGSLPYFFFFLIGMSIWTAFDRCLLWSMRSLEMFRRLADRIAFPRLLLPIGAIAPAIVELLVFFAVTIAIGTVVYAILDGKVYIELGPQLLVAFAMVVVAIAFGVGLGLFLAVLNARARDVRFTVQALTGFGLLLTPIMYPLSAVPSNLKPIVMLNPLTAPVEAFKWGLVGEGQIDALPLTLSLVFIGLTCVLGLTYFSRNENAAVDQL